jgi:hypothetical protein
MTQSNDLPQRVDNLEIDSLNLRLIASAILASVEAHQRESAQRFEQHNQRMAELANLSARQQQDHNLRMAELAAISTQQQQQLQDHEQRLARSEETARDIRQILQLLTQRLVGE